MNNTTEKQKTYDGFAVEITDSTDLGLAILIAESEDGHYEPVAVVDVGSPFKVKFAESFIAFQIASCLYQDDPCKAGLLIPLRATSCDVRPSLAGIYGRYCAVCQPGRGF